MSRTQRPRPLGIPPLRELGHIPGTPDYRRNRVLDGTFFFTVNRRDRWFGSVGKAGRHA
jgi:hypothetical protein